MLAAEGGHVKVVQALLKRAQCTPVRFRMKKEDAQMLSFVDIDARDKLGRTALMFAAYGGKACIVDWLLNLQANLYACDTEGSNALHYACRGSSTGNQKEQVKINYRHFD